MLSPERAGEVPPVAPVPLFLAANDINQLFAHADALTTAFCESNIALTEIVTKINEQQDASLRYRAATMISKFDDLGHLDDSSISECSTKKPIVLVFGGHIVADQKLVPLLYFGDDKLKLNLDACVDVCKTLGLGDISPYVFGERMPYNEILSHCGALAIQIAVAQTWLDYGLQPEVLVGHSTGELAALHIAGVLTMKEVFQLLSVKVKYIEEDSIGRAQIEMVQLMCPAAEMESLIHSFNASGNLEVEVVCFNSDRNYIIAGNERSISEFVRYCNSFDIRALPQRLFFHSSAHGTVNESFRRILDEFHLGNAAIPIEACTKESFVSDFDANQIYQLASAPVHFCNAVRRISARLPGAVWLEAGSSSTALPIVQDILGSKCHQNLMLKTNLEKESTLNSIADASVRLWNSGNDAACWSFAPAETPKKDVPQSRTALAPSNISQSDTDSAYGSSPITPQNGKATEVTAQLKQILSDIMGMPASTINEGSKLSDLGLKSALTNTVMSEVQEYFQINIESALQEQCSTIADVAKCIDEALSRSAARNELPNGNGIADRKDEPFIAQETMVFKTVDGLDLEADIFYPPHETDPSRPLPVGKLLE